MIKININDVSSVYSGRPGCACGCRGKHTYASAHRKWAGENRGYKIEDDEVSDRTVKRIVATVEKLAATHLTLEIMSGFVSVENALRSYIIYFKS